MTTTSQPRVLCVDDEPNVLAALQRTLRRSCSVTTVVGAAAAIEAIQSQPAFCVVISDLRMPGMDGIEFLRWVSENCPDTAGVLLTGDADLSAAIAAVNSGFVFRFLTKPCPPQRLMEAITEASSNCEARRAQRLLLSQAVDQDALTGLPDRRRFCADVEQLTARSPHLALPLIVIAIDGLEHVRGTLGHLAADGLLLGAARRLQTAMRDPQYLVREPVLFRIDDRFVLIWNGSLGPAPMAVAAQLLRAMEEVISVGGQALRITGRAGVSEIETTPTPTDRDEPAALVALRNAEAACSEAGSTDGSRVAQFSATAHARAQRHLTITQLVCHPGFVDRLSLVYQPLWGLRGNRLSGLEALVRCHDPQLGAVSPAEFIPIAEEHPDAAERIGAWVLENACRQRLAWRNWLSDEVRVSVNVSATQLRAGDLHERIARCLERLGMPASFLTIEITESAAIADFARSHEQLHRIASSGVHISIDDFGVGYSSLSYLATLPATGVKIDRSFIDGIDVRGRRAELVRGICSLGHAMGMTVVVEGVESLSLARWLPTVGCDVVQGYAVAKPQSPAALLEWHRVDAPRIAATLAEHEAPPAAALASA